MANNIISVWTRNGAIIEKEAKPSDKPVFANKLVLRKKKDDKK